jgi:hypothetical protein
MTSPLMVFGGPIAPPSFSSRSAGPEFDKSSKEFSGRVRAETGNRISTRQVITAKEVVKSGPHWTADGDP